MRRTGVFALMTLVYAAGATLVYTWFDAEGGPVFFPLAGITLGTLVLVRARNRPAVLAGIVVAETGVDLAHGNDLALSLTYAAANTLEPWVGATLLLAACRPAAPDLGRRHDLLAFLALPVCVAPALGSLVAATGTAVFTSSAVSPEFAGRWWLGDALGVLVVAPVILTATRLRDLLRPPARAAEVAALVAGSVLPVVLTFALEDIRWAYGSAIMLPWVALRAGTTGSALAAALIATVAAAWASHGDAKWSAIGLSQEAGQAYVQLMLAVTAATALLLAAAVGERDDAVGRRALAEEERRRALGRLRREELARRRAEFVAGVLAELEHGEGLHDRAARLLRAIVPQLADFATIEAPGAAEPVLALEHRDAAMVPLLRDLREHHRLSGEDALSLARVAEGVPQLVHAVSRAVLEEHTLTEASVALLERLGLRSCMAVPLRPGAGRRGEPLVLLLGLSDPDRRLYEQDDLDMVLELAARITPALDSARDLDHEQTVATELQRALLPDRLVTHPGLARGARYRPADSRLYVGGDWFESVAFPSGLIGFAVGDVVGHGLAAAAAMGKLRTGLGALAPVCDSAADLLEQLDRFARDTPGAQYSTAAVVIVDPVSGHLWHASAGHPPALLLDAAGSARFLEGGRSWPLCAGEGRRVRDGHLVMQPGDTVVLYSDGLIERRGEALDVGMRRLADEAVRLRHLEVEALCSALLDALTAKRRLRDDVVLLVIRRTGVAPPGAHATGAARPGRTSPVLSPEA